MESLENKLLRELRFLPLENNNLEEFMDSLENELLRQLVGK